MGQGDASENGRYANPDPPNTSYRPTIAAAFKNVNDPRLLTWWTASDHLVNARAYSQAWRTWLDAHRGATAEEILAFATDLIAQYKWSVEMSLDTFFTLRDPLNRRHMRVEPALDAASVETAASLTRAERSRDTPLPVHRVMGGREPADFVWTNTNAMVIVSDRIVSILQEAGVTGWKVYPVVITGGRFEATFQGLALTGRCGPLNWNRGELRTTKSPRLFERQGLYFDPSSWDGNDMFLASDPCETQIFVVDRVRRLLEGARAKNVEFVKVTDIVIPVTPRDLERARDPKAT